MEIEYLIQKEESLEFCTKERLEVNEIIVNKINCSGKYIKLSDFIHLDLLPTDQFYYSESTYIDGDGYDDEEIDFTIKRRRLETDDEYNKRQIKIVSILEHLKQEQIKKDKYNLEYLFKLKLEFEKFEYQKVSIDTTKVRKITKVLKEILITESFEKDNDYGISISGTLADLNLQELSDFPKHAIMLLNVEGDHLLFKDLEYIQTEKEYLEERKFWQDRLNADIYERYFKYSKFKKQFEPESQVNDLKYIIEQINIQNNLINTEHQLIYDENLLFDGE